MRTFPKTIYPAGELNSVAKTFLTLYEEFNNSDVFFSEVIPLIKEANGRLTKLLIKSVNSELNEKLSKADHIRDAAFIAFRDYCKVFENYHIPSKARAARKITDLIRQIGWKMYNVGYSEENRKVNHLITELQTPKYKAAITTIGAEAMISGLQKTQKAFERLYEQEVSNVNAADYPEIREAKKDVGDYLEALISYTAIKAELYPTQFGILNKELDILIVESAKDILSKPVEISTV